MRNCQRNQTTFWYRLYNPSPAPLVDEYGNETGEYAVGYLNPVECKGNISPAKGEVQLSQFGNLENYDKVIVTADMSCPIDENSVLYVGIEPVETDGQWSAFNYTVRRIAKSLNQIAIAIQKVDVS